MRTVAAEVPTVSWVFRRVVVTGLFLGWAVATLTAQGGAPVSGTIKVPVCAATRSGDPGLDLAAGDFDVRLDGKPIEVESFLGSESPMAILLALDVTGDRLGIETVRAELVRFVEVLPPNVQVLLMTLNDGARMIQPNTADRGKLTQAIRSCATTGHPGFLESVEAVARFADNLLKRNPVRIATLVVTDSNVRLYRRQYTTADFSTAAEDLRGALRAFAAPLFILRVPVQPVETLTSELPVGTPGYSQDRGFSSRQEGVIRTEPTVDGAPQPAMTKRFASEVPNRTYEGVLHDLAEQTGGRAEFPLDEKGISTALASLLRRIHAVYVLEVRPGSAPGAEVKPDVRLKPSAGRGGDLRLSFPSRLKTSP
ncbi:MAG: hypothetical protein KA419_07005 [Acidobacteria bacterium]|nr:hypothetical protein [Acidobacteriota bacterium]